ncbi:MAG: hypothetical protein EXQ91_02950 [Alphaproteobacteria bacterium]|nr:hypothetical protein [Alphaproteobacteria bacterium]
MSAVGGGIDLGKAAVSTIAPATPKGTSLRAIATCLPGNDLGVLVPSETGAKTVKVLEAKGISIIYTPGWLEAPFMDAFLKAGGSHRNKIKLIGVDATAKISSYMSGAGGSVVTSTPFLEPVLRKHKPSNVIKFSDHGLSLPSLGLIVGEETIVGKADALRKVVVVTANAWEKILGDANAKKEAIDAIIAMRPNAKLDRGFWMLKSKSTARYSTRTPPRANRSTGKPRLTGRPRSRRCERPMSYRKPRSPLTSTPTGSNRAARAERIERDEAGRNTSPRFIRNRAARRFFSLTRGGCYDC